MDYIVNYLVDVLVHFTRFNPDGTLSLREYIDTIYINIVDVWGFITVYYPIIEMLSASYSKLSENQIKLFKQIQFIFVEYLYNPRHEPIDMTELYGDLSIVGKLLHKAVNGNLETYTSPTPSPSNSETVDYVSRKSRPNTM
jgi:hypothetical protein